MARRDLKSRMIRIVGILLFLYIAYSAVKIGYKSWQFNKVVRGLQEELDIMEQENANLKNNILYYKTDSYKERVMREQLDQKKPGEEVLVIVPEKKPEVKKETRQVKLSNPEKWWIFFFGSELEEN